MGCRCFAGAAEQGELVVNATNGAGSLEALRAAGEANLDGKVLIDIPNPLDLSQGIPPFLLVSNTDSLGEQIQRALPRVKVVKALNTMNEFVMADPSLVAAGEHTVFVSGNDAGQGPCDGDPALVRLEARPGPRRRHHRSWYRDVPALVAPDLGALGTGSSTSQSCSDRPDRRPGLPRHRRHLRDREGDRSGACRDRGDDSPGRAPAR